VLVLRIIWTQNFLVLQKLVHMVTTWLTVFMIAIVIKQSNPITGLDKP
jgi:hypothetical protein